MIVRKTNDRSRDTDLGPSPAHAARRPSGAGIEAASGANDSARHREHQRKHVAKTKAES